MIKTQVGKACRKKGEDTLTDSIACLVKKCNTKFYAA